MKTTFKAKIIVEFINDKYLVADKTEPNYERIGDMIKNGDIEDVEWVFDWLQNGQEPVLFIKQKKSQPTIIPEGFDIK